MLLYKEIQVIFCNTSGQNDNIWLKYFYDSSSIIMQALDREKEISHDYFVNTTIEKLSYYNNLMYKELLGDNYLQSYTNPKYSVALFGDKIGQLNSLVYYNFLNARWAVFQYNILKIHQAADLLLKYYKCYKKHGEDYVKLLKVYSTNKSTNLYNELYYYNEMRYNPKYDYFSYWLNYADFSDLRYLYFYGYHVNEYHLKTAEYLNKTDQQKLKKVMQQTAKAYIDGFVFEGKDYKKKTSVFISIPLGMEILGRYLVHEMENQYSLNCIINIQPSSFNKQLEYDIRYHQALILDNSYADMRIKKEKQAINKHSKIIKACSGTIVIGTFGDIPFEPEIKKECLKLDEKQTELNKNMRNNVNEKLREYYPRSEVSYSIIAFPTAEIGENFEKIFDETTEINMIPNDEWLVIQQCIIDKLDLADYVHIKGSGDNHTDIKIKMQTINNPEKETNYYNCGAMQNIPVGEVFTSPQLNGTKGILHFPEIFLDDLLYTDLELIFEDGRIINYNCKNYDDIQKNKDYIKENLLFPFDSLPIGEFAIGTNTYAYKIANELKIEKLLPVLIAEKLGPHFAIGDTCYSREEDIKTYCPNGKEITAKDNEQSIKRKNGDSNAYYLKHIDLTIRYDQIDFIRAITENKEHIDIINKGKFVLEGCEKLNIHL
jgi:leucyl aminopeptidase (aminopeptidase T)